MAIIDCLQAIKKHMQENGLDKKIPDERLIFMARKLEKFESLPRAEFLKAVELVIENDIMLNNMKRTAERADFIRKTRNATTNITNNAVKWKGDIEVGVTGIVSKVSGGRISSWANTPEAQATEAFRAFIQGGSIRDGIMSRHDIMQLTRMRTERMIGVLKTEISKTPGLHEALKLQNPQFIKDMMQEMWALAHGLEPGQTRSEVALAGAKAAKVAHGLEFEMKRAVSPFIDELKAYMGKQFHVQEKIATYVRENGVEAMAHELELAYGEKSFPELKPEEKFEVFQNIAKKMASGSWNTPVSDARLGDLSNLPGGPGNMARQFGNHVQLIPHDFEAYYNYQKQFGPDTPYEGLLQSIRRTARNVEVINKWGPDPELGFARVFELTRTAVSQIDPAMAEHLSKNRRTLEGYFYDTVSPVSMRGRVIEAAMAWEAISKTGMTVPHSIRDVSNAATLIVGPDGYNIVESAYQVAKFIASNLMPGEGFEKRAMQFGVYSRNIARESMNFYAGGDYKPGFLMKSAEMVSNTLGHTWWANRVRAGASQWAANRLWEIGDKRVSLGLHPETKSLLEAHGINQNTLEILYNHAAQEFDGMNHITVGGIQQIPKEAIESWLIEENIHKGAKPPSERMIAYGRNQLETRLTSYLADIGDQATVQANSRQRAFIKGTDQTNAWQNPVWDMMMLFKTPGVVEQDLASRAFINTGNSYAHMAKVMSVSVFTTMVGEMLAQISKGELPHMPTKEDHAWFIRAVGRGIMGGIMVDIIAHEWNQSREAHKFESVLSGIAGPILSDLGHLTMGGYQKIQEIVGAKKPDPKLGPDMARIITGLVPGQNMPIVGEIMKYLFLNHLHEMLGDTGYVNKLKERAKKYDHRSWMDIGREDALRKGY